MTRKGILIVIFSALAAVGTSVPTAFADSNNPHCGEVIFEQGAHDITAGGGPKQGVPAPTNCDHSYQNGGYIGNGTPPGQ
jgi:hypothetical protein